jgi:hypothetical protein
MERKRFRLLCGFNLALLPIAMYAAYVAEERLPQELSRYLASQISDALSASVWLYAALGGIYFTLALLWIIAAIAVLFFKPWGRTLYTATVIILTSFIFLYGTSIRTPLEEVILQIGLTLDGLIIGLMYFSSIRLEFNDSPEEDSQHVGFYSQPLTEDLAINLNFFRDFLIGLKLLCFLPVDRNEVRPHPTFLFASVALSIAIITGLDYLQQQSMVFVDTAGTASIGALLFLLVLGPIAICQLRNAASEIPALLTLILAALPWYLAIIFLLRDYQNIDAAPAAFAYIAGLIIVFRAYKIIFSQPSGREVFFTLGWVMSFALAINIGNFNPSPFYSYETDEYDKYSQIDKEQVYFSQSMLLDEKFSFIADQSPDKTDFYFLGFAGNGDQEIFRREVNYVQNLMDKKFDTRGKSISLKNDLDSLSTEPLANQYNLNNSLQRLGETMDVEEDVLVLFLTSHGSKEATLQVSLSPFDLQGLSADYLKQALDDSGIQWRVVVISACYSGSFINTLADDKTIVITAADSDKKSFGCNDNREFTYFAEAFFSDELDGNNNRDFVSAFYNARESIGEREKIEDISPSAPQIYIGESIKIKMEATWGNTSQAEPAYKASVQ